MIEANIGHNTVQPGVEAAIEAEGVNIAIDPQKRFLINIPRVFGRPHQVHGEPEDTLIVRANKTLEGVLVAALHCPNGASFIHTCDRSGTHGSSLPREDRPRCGLDVSSTQSK